MNKHEYQMNGENKTAKNDPRNRQYYDAARISSEKNRMKTLDSKKETDVNSHDVVKYETREDITIVRSSSFSTTGLYVGPEAGLKSETKSDLEKHIDESERYYIDITNSRQKTEPKTVVQNKLQKPVPSTMEISAFEPKNITFPSEENMETAVFEKKNTETELASPDTQTVVMATARRKVTQETKAFAAFAPEHKEKMGKTEEKASAPVTENPIPVNQTIPVEEKTENGFEYTSVKQNKQIMEEMRSKRILSFVRIAMAILLSITLFLIENIPAVKALFASHLVYIVVDWLLAFACAVLVFDRICMAFRSLFRSKADADCITLIAFLFSVATTALVLLFETPEKEVMLYNFPFALCVLFDTLFVYYSLRRDIFSFSVISSPSVKRAIVLNDPAEKNASKEYPEQEGDMGNKYGKMREVNFIDGYFSHKDEMPSTKKPLKIILLFCCCISAVFFLCALLVMHHSVSESLLVAYATFMMCVPLSVFLAYSYPAYLAAHRTKTYRSAILCDKTPDVYHDVSMLIFRDTEVFSSGQAKVKSIRLYADKKIDNAIYYASSIYSVIGGPLAEVFKKAALNSVSSENVQICEVCADGACAMVDGKNIVIGRPSYMEEQCFETVNDPGDEEYEGKTNKRIFYLACDQIVIAKFYIQYTVGSDFLDIASRLFAEGIGVGIATADPCFDVGIFYENKIDPEQYAIRVLKGHLSEPVEESVPAQKAGVVSLGDTMDLVKTTLLCKRLENVKKTHLVLKVVSSILGVAVMAMVLFTGKAPEMASVYPAFYQLFWLLPAYFVSKVYL